MMIERRADWIWRQRTALGGTGLMAMLAARRPFKDEKNRFVYFRKSFELEAVSRADAPLHISADGRYQLFVNGQLVGRGIARCDPAWQYYDTYDVAPYLQVGANAIAVLAHSYGRHMSWYQLPRHEASRMLGCGGIFVQAEVNGLLLDSDSSWRYLESEAWQPDTAVGGVGFTEIYDAWLAPSGWQAADFDDSGWANAEVLSYTPFQNAPPVRPFPVMVARDIPALAEKPVAPERLHRAGEVIEAAAENSLTKQFRAEALQPFELCRLLSLPVSIGVAIIPHGDFELKLQTVAGRAVALVFDFGKTVTGRPRFDVSAPEGAIIDVGYSERLQDNHIEPQEAYHDISAQNIDRIICREGRQQWERFEWSGFRYMQLTIRNAITPLILHSADVNFTSYPVEYQGSFGCSDPLLNRIWEAGAYTVQLCMHDGYVDCPSREQRQWVGDAYVESLVNFVAFGDTKLTAKLLKQVAQSQRPDGMTQMTTPGEMAADNNSTIPDYSLYWLMTIREYVRYSGDVSFLPELFPAMQKAMAWFERHLDNDNLLNNVPHWIFIDWAQVDKRGESTILNAQFCHSLMVAAELATMLHATAQAEAWRELAGRVKAAINTHLWDEERGIYVDARIAGEQGKRVSQHANGICCAYDIAPLERRESMLAYITDPERVKLTPIGMGLREEGDFPPFEEQSDVVLAQPFFMHHVNRALLSAGRIDLWLANLRERWGAMLASGGTTIWEIWLPSASQCHGWSATPTFDLTTTVLGIQPTARGFEHVLIAPKPGDLQWAKGSCPTPQGNIAVEWAIEGGSFKLNVTTPPGIYSEIHLPQAKAQVWLNEQLIWQDGEPSGGFTNLVDIVE